MKKSNKEVLDFFGLKVGDKVIVEGYDDHYVIAEEDGIEYAQRTWKRYGVTTNWEIVNFIFALLGNEYEVITPKKKVGDMKCGDFETCKECPFRLIHCGNNDEQVLFDIFNDLKRYLCGDEEIEVIIEKRLNEEVK